MGGTESGGESDLLRPLGFLTVDLLLRVVVPGALGMFLLALTWPEALGALAAVPVAGILGFAVIGFLSYALYHALYIAILSRVSSPQLREARRLLETITGRKPSWIEVRATYIQWRESVAKGDPRLDYVYRVAAYVHAGYQAALLFGTFGFVALFRSLDSLWVVALFAFALLLAAASGIQDRELMEIEKSLVGVSRESFLRYAEQIVGPPKR